MDEFCDQAVLPAAIPANGDLGYYRARHDDFAHRYALCGFSPPVYYLGYGGKYVERFTFETNDRLSPEGQEWLTRTRVLLQEAIENERERDPVAFDQLERNDAAFTRFAYDSHPDAYWDAGLGELSIFDLANIGLTPDPRDLFGWDGMVQAADIAGRLGDVWGSDAIDYLYGEGTAEMAGEGLIIAYEELGNEIDDVFGEGTAQILENTAIATGEDLVSLGQSLHGYASTATEGAIDASDWVFGEGSTEAAINSATETLSDGADWMEDRYEQARARFGW